MKKLLLPFLLILAMAANAQETGTFRVVKAAPDTAVETAVDITPALDPNLLWGRWGLEKVLSPEHPNRDAWAIDRIDIYKTGRGSITIKNRMYPMDCVLNDGNLDIRVRPLGNRAEDLTLRIIFFSKDYLTLEEGGVQASFSRIRGKG